MFHEHKIHNYLNLSLFQKEANFRVLQPADLEIHEVTICASLSTGTSPTTKSIAPLNPEINPGKYEHMCQVEDLNPTN
jgi:hypothetical protein